uniref:Uncharacterized protein n=1 Tax=Anopheles atroparvus TaxID=41427 RepID=A0AAG5CR69_ANOAO
MLTVSFVHVVNNETSGIGDAPLLCWMEIIV